MKIVFMGTPDFSVNALENIVKAGHDVVGVITQPDKPKGRGGKMQYTPVKEKALELGHRIIVIVNKIDRPDARLDEIARNES